MLAKNPLSAGMYLRGVDAERFGDLEDAAEAGIALSPLHAAVVGSIDATPQGERLLGYAPFLADLADRTAKGPVCW